MRSRRFFLKQGAGAAVAALGWHTEGRPAGLEPGQNLAAQAAESDASGAGKPFELPIRYVPHTVNYEDDLSETEWRQVERSVSFEPELSALVMLDCWSWHFMPTLRERMDKIMRERIGPVAKACRRAGFLVVHAPSPPVADKYPRHRFRPTPEVEKRPVFPQPEGTGWPSAEMKRRTGAFREHSLRSDPDAPQLTEEQLYRRYMIHPALGPEPNDFVIADRPELHALLTKHRRFHLFYAGFVSNGCILERDYGVRFMGYLGYNVVLLRDGTTGLEFAYTLTTMDQTRASVENLEFWLATTTSEAFLHGLGSTRH